jgi:hypothetical protein
MVPPRAHDEPTCIIAITFLHNRKELFFRTAAFARRARERRSFFRFTPSTPLPTPIETGRAICRACSTQPNGSGSYYGADAWMEDQLGAE